MHNLAADVKDLIIKLNTEDLSPTQVRLVKTINAMMAHVLTCEEESEYFEASGELLRKFGELVKASHFAVQNTEMDYGDQAVEFAVDFLNEEKNGHNIDN